MIEISPFIGGFQLTPPRGERPPPSASTRSRSGFNSRPARGATRQRAHVRRGSAVSTHAPAQEATLDRVSVAPPVVEVSTHAPRRERPGTPEQVFNNFQFQLTPRAGSDVLRPTVPRSRVVSTHAAAPGATVSVRSVTLTWNFQLTPPRGEQTLVAQCVLRGIVRVSTHAPLGERRASTSSPRPPPCFNSRSCARSDHPGVRHTPLHVFRLTPPRGATLAEFRAPYLCEQFQLTLPRRERRHRRSMWHRQWKFQLTPARWERPVRHRVKPHGVEASMHVPARGATSPHALRAERPPPGPCGRGRARFNSRPRRGATRRTCSFASPSMFQLTSARGATNSWKSPQATTSFQLTPPRGERLHAVGRRWRRSLFQLTPPRRERRDGGPAGRGRLPCFNSRPRGDRHGSVSRGRPPPVSTHAARGERRLHPPVQVLGPVSTHAQRGSD